MDNWVGMEFDPEALERIRRSCDMLGCQNGMTVLDIGCYRQTAKKFLPPCSYHGFDIGKFSDGIIVRDLENGFLWDKRVDRILCLEVLEHLKTPSRVLRSIQEYLKDDGIAIISLPNEASAFHRLRSLLGTVDAEAFSEAGKHLHLPSLKQASAFVSKYLEILKVECYISTGNGTRQLFLSKILKRIPKQFLKLLSVLSPSLFSRGFIFKVRKKVLPLPHRVPWVTESGTNYAHRS